VLGQVGIVLGAHQAEVVGAVVSAQAEGVNVVVLEVVSRLAPPPRRVDVAASPSVSLVDGPANRCGNAPRGGRRVGRRQVLAGPRRRSEAAGLEPLQLFRDGRFDDRTEIPVGDLRAHELAKPPELFVQAGAGGELHPEPPGGEGLDDGRRGMRTRRA
jgi:hypothetical protein